MADDTDLFEPRLGHMRARGGKVRAPKLRSQIFARAARTGAALTTPRTPVSGVRQPSGRFNARGRGAKLAATFPRGSGWSFDHGLGTRVRPRRVAVKARVVKLAGKAQAALAHLRYLERDGVARDGAQGRVYSAFSDDADGEAFLERGGGDRHQFRFIVSAEDGNEFADLRPFTRDLMAQMERDLGTTLDWIAIDHHDTGHPHTHILIRGKADDGKTLNIAGDYIAHGVRHRASQIMTRALGPQTEREVHEQLKLEVDAERLTRLDRALLQRAAEGPVDLALAQGGDPAFQQLLMARARKLEAMDLATREAALVWTLDPATERTLSDMGRRGDIIRTMHREMAQTGLGRRPELYVIRDPQDQAPLVGKVVRFGAAADHHDRRFLLIDGVDGRTHYADIGMSRDTAMVESIVRLSPKRIDIRPSDRTIAEVAAAHGGIYSMDNHLKHDAMATERFAETHVRRLEALRRAGGPAERLPDGRWQIAPDHLDRLEAHQRNRIMDTPIVIETLSDERLALLSERSGPTWLDRELVSDQPLSITNHGFGSELRAALVARRQWLLREGLGEERAGEIRMPTDLVARLRSRELAAVASRLSDELGLDFSEAKKGGEVRGVLTRGVTIGSERFGLVQRSKEFMLVPWSDVLERRLGQQVGGIVRDGGVNWSFGRQRSGPSIG
jgi:type IV secretory pathway VirD2 relaxase